MRFHLVRHGETAPIPPNSFYGGADVPLSDAGKAQASSAADCLANEPIECIISSPLNRAIYGADQVGLRHPNADRLVVDDLREVDRGRWVGHDLASLNASYPNDWSDYIAEPLSWCGHGGESLQNVYDRVGLAFDSLLALPYSSVVIVAHMFPIRALVSKCQLSRDMASDMMNIVIPTASISKVVYNKDVHALVTEEIGYVPY
ncbi:MAG: histidine phosphatase family protein [Planctomycetes bacterium]|nr:histidine phosphatase family protein [Planctomycetota bacterium]